MMWLSLKHRPWRALFFLIGLLAVCANTAVAETVDESQLKMALAYNFARYTQWPEVNGNFRFCVMGGKTFYEGFAALNEREVDGRNIDVLQITLEDDLASCQLLYISNRERNKIGLVLEQVADAPVLTIGELPEFIDNGGIIRLFRQQGKIRFAINPKTAQRSNLKISSRLLRFAVIEDE